MAFLLFFLLSFAAAHICLINPPQRGDLDISGPGTGSCFKKVGPCGNLPPQTPTVSLIGGQANNILFQQNLNHYSVGSPGWFDVGLSQLSDPKSEDDFEIIDTFHDYYAYHQWTQTNMTFPINVPNFQCSHCVIRIRYLPRKPTEPIFHQCADVVIRGSAPPPAAAVSDQKAQTIVEPISSSAALLPFVGLSNTNGVTTVYGIDPSSGATQLILQLDAPPRSSRNQGVHSLHKTQVSTAYIADSVVAVNKAAGQLFLLKANTVNDLPTILLTIDLNNKTLISQTPITGLIAPLSGIHYDSVAGSLVAFGLRNVSSDWYYYAGRINLASGVFTESVASQDVDPYVDFTFSDYEPTSTTLYILARHEDEPTVLYAQLFIVNLGANTITNVNLTLDFIFSSFIIDNRSPNTLLAFSPGPVDDNGDVLKPVWQIVSISTTSGRVTSVVPAALTANQYPVWWGGGSFGFSNSKASSQPSTESLHFLATTSAHFPHPTQLQPLSYNLNTNNITLLNAKFPYFFNLIAVN